MVARQENAMPKDPRWQNRISFWILIGCMVLLTLQLIRSEAPGLIPGLD